MRLLLFNLVTDAADPILGFTTNWIQGLAEHVEHIDVITMQAGRIEVPDNVRVYSVGKEKGYSEPRRAIEFYRILGSLSRDQHYDACFAHMMPLFALMAAPVLWVKHIPIVLWYTHKSVTCILRLATIVVNRVVTASPESFRIKSPKVRIIGHGIDTDKFAPAVNARPPDRPLTILTVSRLSPIKRIELLIQAMACLRQKNPELPVCLKIVGGPLTTQDQTYVGQLRQQVEQAGLREMVHFVGNIPFHSIVPYYQQADCFVSLSATGSLDKAVLEAMSCGVPVIVNQVFAEVLGQELTKSWVIDWNPDQLCERLLVLASLSGSKRCEIGQALRAIVVRDHALQKLCMRIIYELQALSGK